MQYRSTDLAEGVYYVIRCTIPNKKSLLFLLSHLAEKEPHGPELRVLVQPQRAYELCHQVRGELLRAAAGVGQRLVRARLRVLRALERQRNVVPPERGEASVDLKLFLLKWPFAMWKEVSLTHRRL